ncbi:MAG: hypothetical protein U0031_02510 [Thermomicrobiales bacterium]
MEEKMKGLFGGGEAHKPDHVEAGMQTPRGGGRRANAQGIEGGGGGGRRRRRQLTPEERVQAEDFINRYTTGHPSEGFSSDEAINYLRQMHGEVPPEVMQRAAVATVNNLPPDQRKEFAEMLQRRQAGSGMVTIERTGQAHDATGRAGGGAAAPGMDDLFGNLLGGLLGGQPGGQPQPQPRQMPQSQPQAGGGMDDVLGGLLGTLLGGGMAQPAPRGAGQASDPFGDILGSLLGGGAPAPEPPAPRQRQVPQQQPQAQAQEGGGIGDILGSPLGKAVLGGIAAFAMKEMMDKSRKG